jgi:uncharacterized cupin superfamily protein
MRSTTANISVTIGLCVLGATVGAAEIPASVARCKAITDDTARLACYDAATGRSGEGYITASPASAAAVAAGTSSSAAATTAAARAATLEPASDKAANSFESRIKTATRRSNGMWVIALEDGTSWLQADSTQEWTLKAGDPVVLSRGAMGAWFVKKTGSNRTFRVRPDTR